jgi:hypothetical protein
VKLGSKGFIDDTYFADWDLTGWDADIISDFPLPSQFKLYAPYPNPFNTSVTITFYLPSTTNVKLTVYDITGRVVTIIDPGHLTLGSNNVEWDASGQASGIYFVQFKAGDFAQTQKILLLR